MQLSNQQILPVAQHLAWDALNDISLLQQAIPGCEGITVIEDNHYEVIVVAAIGPVKARFKGKLLLSELNAPTSYTLHFEGQGGAAGHGKGHAEVRLEPQAEHITVLHYTAHATVGGKIAQIGSRLVDMAANKMANEFFAAFNERLQERHGVQSEAAGEGDVAGESSGDPAGEGKFKKGFKKLFGG